MQTQITWPVWGYAWRIYRFLPWRYLGYFLIIRNYSGAMHWLQRSA
jgi:hypothetical protein